MKKPSTGLVVGMLAAVAALAAAVLDPVVRSPDWLIVATAAVCPPLLFILHGRSAGRTMAESILKARRHVPAAVTRDPSRVFSGRWMFGS